MSQTRDYLSEQIQVGRESARQLQDMIRRMAFENFNVGQTRYTTKSGRPIKGLPVEGSVGKTRVTAVIEDNELNSLRISIPRHAMVLNFGYERVYSNGTRMRMEPTDIVTHPVYGSGILDDLGHKLAEIRADEAVSLLDRYGLKYKAMESAKAKL